MNVIDALVITLGLDAKDLKKGNKEVDSDLKKLRETSAKTAKDMVESGKRAAEMFSSIKIELLGLLAAFGAATGLKDFVFGSIASGAALGRLAANLHMSAKRLDAWRTVAEGVGETADGVAQSLQNIAAGLVKGQFGDASYFQAVAKFGVNLSADMTPEQAALLIAKRMKEFDASGPAGRQLALALAQAAGIGGMAQTELLPNLKQLLAQYTAASGESPEVIKQQMELQRQVSELKQRLRTVSQKIFVKLGPELEKIGAAIEKIDWDKVSRNLQTWFDDAGKLITSLGGVKGILIDIAAIKVFSWAAGLGATIVRVRALTAALVAARAAAAGGAAPGGVIPPAAATGGFWSKLLGMGGLLGLLRAAAAAPRPADDRSVLDQLSPAERAKFDADSKKSWWQRVASLFGGDSSPSPPAAPVSPPHKQMAVRADDNIDLFGGKYGGKFGALESKYNLPPGILQSVENAESHGNDPNFQRSPKGALGPFQFEPATAADYGLSGNQVFNEKLASVAAARYLADLIKLFHGNIAEALAAYNWGQGNVMRNGMNALPQETSDYVQKVLGGIKIGSSATAAASRVSTSTSTTQTHIGQVVVNTKATDARGIARDMHQALADNTLVTQADTGLN